MIKQQYFILSLQYIAFIVALFTYKKHDKPIMFLMCIYFFLSLFTETIGIYFIENGLSVFIHQIIYAFLEFIVVTILYHYLLENRKNTLPMLILILICGFNCFYVFYYDQSYYSYLIILNSIIFSIYLFMYLRKLLISPSILNYKTLLPFWITIGFLVFYLPTVPFFAMFKFMKTRDYFYVLNFFIIMMNLVFIFGFLWSKKDNSYS